MIEKYLDTNICERFQKLRLSIGGRCWGEDDYFISELLDTYEDFQYMEFKYRKLKLKYRLLKSIFKL